MRVSLAAFMAMSEEDRKRVTHIDMTLDKAMERRVQAQEAEQDWETADREQDYAKGEFNG